MTSTEITRFQVGQTYAERSLCDYDSVVAFTITKRTAKSVWTTVHGKPVMRRVSVIDGRETFAPYGHYSMSMTVLASSPPSREVRT